MEIDMHSRLCKIRPVRVIPKLINPILAGYHWFDGGLGLSWFGWMLKLIMPKVERELDERLAHAAGALDDIYILATSCVSPGASEETHELAKAVTHRILSSAHQTHRRPSWFQHDWEEQLWQERDKTE